MSCVQPQLVCSSHHDATIFCTDVLDADLHHQGCVVTHGERSREVGDAAELADDSPRETLADVEVVEGEQTMRRPVLLECLGCEIGKWVYESCFFCSQLVQWRRNHRVFVVEVTGHDERALAMAEQLREIAAHRHQVLCWMTDEVLLLVLAIGQVEPDHRGDELGTAPDIGGRQ